MKKLLLIFAIFTFLFIPITANAFTIESYISYSSEKPIAIGYSDLQSEYYGQTVYYKNNNIDTSKYIIYRNCVRDKEKTYDLIVYPFSVSGEKGNKTSIQWNLPYFVTYVFSNNGYKLLITEHVDNGIGNPVDWTGMIGFADLDEKEFIILPHEIDTNSPGSHVGKDITVSYTSYGYKYSGKVSGDSSKHMYDECAIWTKILIPKDGLIIYYGCDEYSSHHCELAFDSMKPYVEQNWPSYNVTYIDIDEYGNELGKTTRQVDYSLNVRGFDIGSDTSDSAYYNDYYLYSDTSATVTGNGICVYRIFKECIFDISGSIYWVDKNDKLGLRPDEVTINVYQDGELLDSVVVDAFNGNTYSFNELPIYRTDGTKYEYTVEEIIPAVYGSDGKVYDAYKINANMPEDYDFTNIIQFPGADVDIITDHKTDVVVKTNLEEKVPIQLTPTELFIDEELDICYGELKDNPINIFTDNIGETIKNIPPGKYEISVDTYYDLTDISISNNEHVFLQQEDGKWYLIVESTPEDGFGIINIELSKNKNKYQDIMRIQNYFNL